MAARRKGMQREYDKTHPSVATRVTLDQRALLAELASKRGMTTPQYIRDVIFREYVESLGLKWPEGYFDGGAAITQRGGDRGGRRPRIAK